MIDLVSPTSCGALGLIREQLRETAERASLYAQHAVDYAALGDDRGLARSIRLLAICAVNAAETLPLLAEAVRRDKALAAFFRAE